MTASAVLAVALEARRLLETLPAAQREEALLLVLDDEPVEPEDITRAQVAELDPDVAAAFPTELPVEPEGARAEQPAQSGRPAHMDAREEGAARLVELVQLVANAGGKAEVGWLAERLGVSEVATRKHIRRAIRERYLIQPKRGVVEINPAPDAPVVVADRSRERQRVLGTARGHIAEPALARVVDLLTRHGPQTERELATRIGAATVTIKAQISELVKQRRVLTAPDGKWKAVVRG